MTYYVFKRQMVQKDTAGVWLFHHFFFTFSWTFGNSIAVSGFPALKQILILYADLFHFVVRARHENVI